MASELEQALAYTFHEPDLLKLALQHSSMKVSAQCHSNERLEFLGDAFLNAIMARWLYELYPEESEGQLSKYKSYCVNNQTLQSVALEIGLQEHVVYQKKSKSLADLTQTQILSNAMEAVIGAIVIDGGMEAAEACVKGLFYDIIDETSGQVTLGNYKGFLQEWCLKHKGGYPQYETLSAEGADHLKEFCVEVSVGEEKSQGYGSSIKAAQQQAAFKLLEKWGCIPGEKP